MSETIGIGGLELRFLQTKEETAGSLDAFEMTVQPNARMPVAHYHESWDETIYGLTGAVDLAGRRPGHRARSPVSPSSSSAGSFTPSATIRRRRRACLCILTPGVLGPGYFREIAALLAEAARRTRQK